MFRMFIEYLSNLLLSYFNIFLGVLVLLLALVDFLDGVSSTSFFFLFAEVLVGVFAGSFFVGVLIE